MMRFCLICCCYFCFLLNLSAQENTESALLHSNIDSSSKNIDTFNPLLSTAVIAPRKFEIIFFNHFQSKELTTTNISPEDTTISYSKQSALNHILQLNYGLNGRRRINIGADFIFTHLRVDSDVNSSVWRVLGNDHQTGESKRSLHSLGPRIRIAPFASVPEFSFQTSLRFPIINDEKFKQELGVDRVLWQNQAIFYQHILQDLTWQLQADYSVFLKNSRRLQTTHYFSYLSHFIYQLYTERIYIIGSILYNESREHTFTNKLKRNSFDLSVGGGLYWQIKKDRLSIVGTADFPVKYDIGSLITKVNAKSWWRATIGLNYRLNFAD